MILSKALGIKERGIITAVGAGGKSSLLMSLGTEWQERGSPFLLTTTTKMFFSQVRDYAPVLCRDYDRGRGFVLRFLQKYGYAAWFTGWRGTKVDGLPPEWVDRLFQSGIVPHVFVEGDGARRKLLKAPRPGEPVVSPGCDLVIGVLNLQALGRKLSPRIVHRLEKVAKLLGKKAGDVIEPEDLGILAGHEEGIFMGTGGRKVLVLASGSKAEKSVADRIMLKAKSLCAVEISSCVLTEGYGKTMKPLEVLNI